jgi:hypothetical protein
MFMRKRMLFVIYTFHVLVSVSFLIGCHRDKSKDFQQEIAVKLDTFSIDNSKDTLINCPKGTVLFFPRQAFALKGGKEPIGKITILVKECLSLTDMIRDNLTTISGGQLLESRGMVQVKALAGSNELQLKEGKSFIVHFPKDSADRAKPMNLFYGTRNKNETMDWKLDSGSLLRPSAFVVSTGIIWSCDINVKEDDLAFRDDTSINLIRFVSDSFDNRRLTFGNKLYSKYYKFSFTRTGTGELRNKKIYEVHPSDYSRVPAKTAEIDPYVIEFLNKVPALNPNFCKDKRDTSDGDIVIGFRDMPDFRNREDYNAAFDKKYAPFKNQAIRSVNDAELNYYVFTCSKLGWINCDYFWNTNDKKIDYVVGVDANEKSDVKLIFKGAKSIMQGTREGNKFVFHQVPINQEVKIVAITFEKEQPLLAVTQAKTSKQAFQGLQYKPFTLSELEKQLKE